jgi:tRNA U54 and U55 pseudouridine synthase Pus10
VPGLLAACGGRYQKLSRQLPQSAWVVNGIRLGKGSVEEIVGDPIKEVRRAFF